MGVVFSYATPEPPKKICGQKICGRFFVEIVDKRLVLWYNIIIKWESFFNKKNKAIKKDAYSASLTSAVSASSVLSNSAIPASVNVYLVNILSL